MVFNFRTIDLTEDPVDFGEFASSTSPSSSSSDCTCTCTKTIVTRVIAPASHLFSVPAINKARRERPSDPLDISGVISKSNLRSFSLKELQVATSNFSDKFVVGRGGFGKVYKGLLPDGSFVAIKRLDQSSRQGSEEFQAEVDIGSTLRHRNVVAAIGFCVSEKPEEKLLVYTFKVNGELSSRLRKHQSQPPLDWPTRKRILLGAARGLLYLHNNRIIHRDIKPSNILMDENLEACIGDFGLAMALDKKEEQVPSTVSELQNHDVLRFATERELATNSSTYYYYTHRVVGTHGYMAPEFVMHGKCSVKMDVYSFGITIFEVITGKKSTDIWKIEQGYAIYDWMRSCLKENKMDKLLDPNLLGNCMEDDVKKTIQLGLACTLKFPEKRPRMLQVFQVLEGADLKDIGTDTDYIMMAEEEQKAERQTWVNNDSCSLLRSEELSGPR